MYVRDEADGYPQISRTRGASSEGAPGVGRNFEGGGTRAAVTADTQRADEIRYPFQVGLIRSPLHDLDRSGQVYP